jgi:hypothetical protein
MTTDGRYHPIELSFVACWHAFQIGHHSIGLVQVASEIVQLHIDPLG